ncbi:OsmC family protein [Enterococcus sp. LJL98]
MSVETFTLNKVGQAFTLETKSEPWILTREDGYSPVQSLVTSVAACAGYVYASVLEKSKVPHEIEKITASYTRNMAEKTNPIQSIDLVIYTRVPVLHQEKAERCVKLISPNCPVIQSIDPKIEVVEKVLFI